jgi:hypothetical protein
MPHTDSKVSSEEDAGGERGSESRGGGEWHNVEGKWGSVGSLSTVNSLSADDIFQSTSSPSSSPPASRHTVDVFRGSSSTLAGASGPLNRIDGIDSTAISPSANVSTFSPAVHPCSILLEESETSRGDDESSGDDCDSCLYSVSSLDRNPDSYPDPDPTLSAGSVPVSLPVSLRVPTKASHSSLSAGDRSSALTLGRESPRSRVGVGVGSRTDSDLSGDPGPAAGIPSGKLLEGGDKAVAFIPRISLISDRAVTAPVPVERAAPAAEVEVEVADGSVSSGGAGSKSALRAVVEGMTPLPLPLHLTRLSNEINCEGDVLHAGVTDSGTRPKSRSKSNSKDKSKYKSAGEGKGDTVGVALAAAGRHLGEVQIRTQGGDDKDTDINADKDAGNKGDRVVLVPPHHSPAPRTEELTAKRTARDANLEGDGAGAETEMPSGLLGLEMLEEESV